MDFSSYSNYNEFANNIPFVGNILQQSEPIKKDLAGPSTWYRFRSDCLYSLLPFFFQSQTEEPVPVTGMCYNILLWMCTLNNLTWPDLAGTSVLYLTGSYITELDAKLAH